MARKAPGFSLPTRCAKLHPVYGIDAGASELKRLGGSIHQDDAPPLSAAEELAQRAGIERYLELLDALDEDQAALADPAVAAAVLWSLHPIDDYGIYETVYGALAQFTPSALVRAAVEVLPPWLSRHGDHASIQVALAPLTWDPEAMKALLDEAERWSPADRATVREAVTRWVRDDNGWEPLFSGLGGVVHKKAKEPIPEAWPKDWRDAAVAFRATGRVNLAWAEQKDFSRNFDRVFAIMELEHGAKWRLVPDLLNPLIFSRREDLPRFVAALAALPEERRARILANVGRARPDLAKLIDPRLRDGETSQGR